MATRERVPATTVPDQGQLVEVRERRWVVADVDAGELPRNAQQPLEERQHLLTLRSVEDDAEPNESLQVVWELEPGARAFERAGLPDAKALDDPERFDAFLDAVRWGASSSADSRRLLAPFQSGVEIEAYQLDPLARAIRMPRVSLLIADDVGHTPASSPTGQHTERAPVPATQPTTSTRVESSLV